MPRILITGKNCELSREAFSRAARLASASSLQTGRAAFYSGAVPESVSGGSRLFVERETGKDNRNLVSSDECSEDLEPPIPYWLEVRRSVSEELGLLLILNGLAFACIFAAML